MKSNMSKSTYPPTPELDKMKAVHDKSQAIGEFLDWVLQEKKTFLATEHEHDGKCGFISRMGRGELCHSREGDLLRLHYSIEKLLAEFFEIDLNKVESERRAILQSLHP